MNEPIFKNVFVRDEETLREFYKHNYLAAPLFRIIYIGYAVLLLMSLLASLLAYDLTLFASYLFLGLVFALILFFKYSQSLKITVARDKELANGRDMVTEIFVFDDKIEHTALGNSQALGFESIKRVQQSQNYIYVISNAKLVYIFKKDSFTLGTPEEFIEFLKSKGIKIQK